MRIAWLALAAILVGGCGSAFFGGRSAFALPDPTHRRVTIGTGARDLEEDLLVQTVAMRPKPSPDGRTILIVREVVRGDPRPALLDASAPRAAPRLVTTVHREFLDAAWFPDGRSIAVTYDAPDGRHLARIALDAPAELDELSQPERIPSLEDIQVASDGSAVVGSAHVAGEWSIVRVDVAEGTVRVLVAKESDSALSPDGALLASTAPDSPYAVRIRRVADLGPVDTPPPWSDPSFDCGHPSFAPGGDRVLFECIRRASTREPVDRRTLNLFAARTDGTHLVQLTDGDATIWDAGWAPDGHVWFDVYDTRARLFHLGRLRVRDDAPPAPIGGVRVHLVVTHAEGVDVPIGTSADVTVHTYRGTRDVRCLATVVLAGLTLHDDSTFWCFGIAERPPRVLIYYGPSSSRWGATAITLDSDAHAFEIHDDASGKLGAFLVRGTLSIVAR